MLPKSLYFLSIFQKKLSDGLFFCFCGLKTNVHENKIFLFNTFRLAFSLSSLFWYMYIIIISPFHLSVHIIMVMVMLHHTSGSNHLIFMGEGAMEFKKKNNNSLIMIMRLGYPILVSLEFIVYS